MALDGKLTIASAILVLVTAASIVFLTGGLVSRSGDVEDGSNVTMRPPVVLRIDDIQDYAYRSSQSWLLGYHASSGIPVDLAVIMGYTGDDIETIYLIRECLRGSSEVSVHGWLHEDLSLFSEEEQMLLIRRASEKMGRLFGYMPTILVPPMFSYDNATLEAMVKTGYTILSSSTDQSGPSSNKIRMIPATVELSKYENQTWSMKQTDAVLEEVRVSVELYGYAVIVLHPQEFMSGDKIDAMLQQRYERLVNALSQTYEMTDIEGLAGMITTG